MPFVIKSHPQEVDVTRSRSARFTEWAYENARPITGADAVWFTAETSGGFGLYALGQIVSESEDAGKNLKGNRLVSFTAVFRNFDPREPLRKVDFAALPRTGRGSPIQELNRRLYLNSHVKVAEIDGETFRFLANRF